MLNILLEIWTTHEMHTTLCQPWDLGRVVMIFPGPSSPLKESLCHLEGMCVSPFGAKPLHCM